MGCTLGSPSSCPSAVHRHVSCNIVECVNKNLARNKCACQTDRKQQSVQPSGVEDLHTVSAIVDNGQQEASEALKSDVDIDESMTTTMNRLLPSRSHGDLKSVSPLTKLEFSKQTTLPSIWNSNMVGPTTFRSSDVHASAAATKKSSPMTRVQSPHVRKIRMRLERQHSDDGCISQSRFPPIRASKLRKSASCNDSWLTDIGDTDDDDDEVVHLPAISEVDLPAVQSETFDDSDIATYAGDLSSRLAYGDNHHQQQQRTSLASVSSLMMPSSTIMSTVKRLKARSHSTDGSRLPVILEDVDNPTSTSVAQPIYDPQFRPLNVLEEDADTEYSVRMYVASMTELLELEDMDPRDLPLLRNVSIDPNSPLLVKYVDVQSQNNKGNGPREAPNDRNNAAGLVSISRNNNNNNNNNNIDGDNSVTKDTNKRSDESTIYKTSLVEQNGVG